jgi:hypothetical protein
MATWYDIVNYVRSHYKIADEDSNMVKLLFNTEGLRSQVVFLWRNALLDGEEDWLQIESPFAQLDSANLQQVLEEVGKVVCGGAALNGNYVTIRHAVPLANVDTNEFERPLILVTTTADRLEKQLIGGDAY